MQRRRFLLAAFGAGLVGAGAPGGAAAEPAARAPGALLLLRHARAPGTGDPPGFRLGDCATQRNLSAEGRAQAAAIGRALASAGVVPRRIASSRWCRARETAELLALGPVEEWAELDSFFGDRARGPGQTAALLARLSPLGGPLLLVTHQVNITALTGLVPAEGEVIVAARARAAPLPVTARLPPPPG
jgi:phosphohistidine phosphatase SixA